MLFLFKEYPLAPSHVLYGWTQIVQCHNNLRSVADIFHFLMTHQCFLWSKRSISQKWSPPNWQDTVCGESWKYILVHNQNEQTLETKLSQSTDIFFLPYKFKNVYNNDIVVLKDEKVSINGIMGKKDYVNILRTS